MKESEKCNYCYEDGTRCTQSKREEEEDTREYEREEEIILEREEEEHEVNSARRKLISWLEKVKEFCQRTAI